MVCILCKNTNVHVTPPQTIFTFLKYEIQILNTEITISSDSKNNIQSFHRCASALDSR